MFNGAEGGVYVSNDFGQTWYPSSQGLGARDVYGLHAPVGDSRRLYAATSDGVFVTENGGKLWQPANPPATWRPTPVAPGGRQPANTPTARPSAKGRRAAARPSASRTILRQRLKGHVVELVSTTDGWLYAAAWEGLFRTDNPARGWEKVSLGAYRGRVFSVAVSPQSSEVILAGISDGMLMSQDGGATWQRADLPMKAFKDATCVQEIAFHPRRPETMFVGTRRTAYVSFDGGKSWERLARGIGFGDIAVIRFNPRQADEVLIGDAQGGGAVSFGQWRAAFPPPRPAGRVAGTSDVGGGFRCVRAGAHLCRLGHFGGDGCDPSRTLSDRLSALAPLDRYAGAS